jgi:hypothetical protein
VKWSPPEGHREVENEVGLDPVVALVEALVGDRHRYLYVHDGSFHHSIEVLARMLLPMVDGLALSCHRESEDRRQLVDRIRMSVTLPDLPEDLRG